MVAKKKAKKKTKKKRERKYSITRINERIRNSMIISDNQQRAKWARLAPEITFVLFLCDAIRKRETIEVIADQAARTYPKSFVTRVGGKKVPDLALVLLTLNEAKKREWGYLAGNWFRGWRLTKKGRAFAEDVWRRKMKKKK